MQHIDRFMSQSGGAEQKLQPGRPLISATDAQGVIRFCNDDFEAISGFTRAELLIRPTNSIKPHSSHAGLGNMF